MDNLTSEVAEELATMKALAGSIHSLANQIVEEGGLDGPEDLLLVPGLREASKLIATLHNSILTRETNVTKGTLH